MILLYSALVFVLGAAAFVMRRRAKSLEKKYARVAKEADALVKQPAYKEGNSNRVDPYVIAKRQFQLGVLAQKRDRVEARYVAWEQRADRFGRYVNRLRSWKGKKLPYTFGAVDLACVFATIDYLGFGDVVGVRPLVQLLTGLFTR
jgi:hypothetical protein